MFQKTASPPPGGPKLASGAWRSGFAGAPFGPLEERSLPHVFETDREGVAAYYVSISSLAQLAREEREDLRRELLAMLSDARYSLQLLTKAFSARRLESR